MIAAYRTSSWLQALQQIGSDLDSEVYPSVRDGGLVVPSGRAIDLPMGTEHLHGKRNEARTEPQQWEWPAGWQGTSGPQGSTGRPGSTGGPPGTAASFVRGVRTVDDSERLSRAYPGTRTWSDPDGCWLLSPASLFDGLGRAAAFVVAVPNGAGPKAWGFWRTSSLTVGWIGPRHTNFPDGSICAFAPEDQAWTNADPIEALIDLYSVWAVRQLHLEMFGRWPGRQQFFHRFERWAECLPNEICDCGSGARYGGCCTSRDLGLNMVREAVRFTNLVKQPIRLPPLEIALVAVGASAPPPLRHWTQIAS